LPELIYEIRRRKREWDFKPPDYFGRSFPDTEVFVAADFFSTLSAAATNFVLDCHFQLIIFN